MMRLSFLVAKFATQTRIHATTRVYASIFMRAVRQTQEWLKQGKGTREWGKIKQINKRSFVLSVYTGDILLSLGTVSSAYLVVAFHPAWVYFYVARACWIHFSVVDSTCYCNSLDWPQAEII